MVGWKGREIWDGREQQRTSVVHSYAPLRLLPHRPIWLPDEESTCEPYSVTGYLHSESKKNKGCFTGILLPPVQRSGSALASSPVLKRVLGTAEVERLGESNTKKDIFNSALKER